MYTPGSANAIARVRGPCSGKRMPSTAAAAETLGAIARRRGAARKPREQPDHVVGPQDQTGHGGDRHRDAEPVEPVALGERDHGRHEHAHDDHVDGRDRPCLAPRAVEGGPVESDLVAGGDEPEDLDQPHRGQPLGAEAEADEVGREQGQADAERGIPHISASRVDFTKDSNSRSVRSRTAQIAGYSVVVMIPSSWPV
jgi:hypothetical protein